MRTLSCLKTIAFIPAISVFLLITSCKHEAMSPTPKTLGVYGYTDSTIYNLLYMAVSKIGTQTTDYGLVFDTGSGGMVIDAQGILPASMITSNGFAFSGDSVIVNGITITNQTSTIVYGDDCSTINDKVYGNLAYAQVTVGDAKGNIVIKRLPFFLYYKAVKDDGSLYDAHEFDVFGVSEEYDISFVNNGAYITSPFSYYDPGPGLTRGFKIAQLNGADFSANGTYANVVKLGLTQADLGQFSGFAMTPLTFYQQFGYVPYIPGKVVYDTGSYNGYLLFDTGTEPYNYLEDPKYAYTNARLLPSYTTVSIAAFSGFNTAFITTGTDNPTYVENSPCSGVSVFGLDFFFSNEYLYNFETHAVGLKNL